MDFFANHVKDVGTFLGGVLTGALGGSLITLRFMRKNSVKGGGSISDQSGARAGGDIVGRDKTMPRR